MTFEFQNWLKNNGIEKLEAKLKNEGIEALDDIGAIESMHDLNEFVKELDLKVIERSKLKNAMLKVVQFESLNQNSSDTVNTSDEKKCENDEIDDKMASMEINKDGKHNINYHNRKEMKGLYQVPFVNKKKKIRTILLIGETGIGKSTAINSMMNYLWNVNYNDKFRYKLIVENSMTQDVTLYYVEPPKLNYSLCIVDTPGFGGTKSVTRDDNIVKQIQKCFSNEVETIDGIFFTVSAARRFTIEHEYIYDNIFGLFGTDVKRNIFTLINFSDAKKPCVVEPFKAYGYDYGDYFKLNSIWFDLPKSEEEEKDPMGPLFWEMGMRSFDRLFDQLGKAETKSLKVTTEVLQKREELEAHIKGADPLIRKGLKILEQIRDNIVLINKEKELVQSKVKALKQVIAALGNEFNKIENEMNAFITANSTKVNECVNEVRYVVLRSSILTKRYDFHQMMINEEKEARQGWKERVWKLQVLATKRHLINKIYWDQFDEERHRYHCIWNCFPHVTNYLRQEKLIN